jgi:putative FmdB family regulatory protein
MPIYEFQCQSCGHEEEVLQKISDAPLTVCPACGKSEMIKKVSAAAFRLSGGGWYETDFKSGDKKKNLTESVTDKKPAVDSKPAAATSEKKPVEKSPSKSA